MQPNDNDLFLIINYHDYVDRNIKSRPGMIQLLVMFFGICETSHHKNNKPVMQVIYSSGRFLTRYEKQKA